MWFDDDFPTELFQQPQNSNYLMISSHMHKTSDDGKGEPHFDHWAHNSYTLFNAPQEEYGGKSCLSVGDCRPMNFNFSFGSTEWLVLDKNGLPDWLHFVDEIKDNDTYANDNNIIRLPVPGHQQPYFTLVHIQPGLDALDEIQTTMQAHYTIQAGQLLEIWAKLTNLEATLNTYITPVSAN